MRQFLIPIILVAAAIGLFVLYTNPAYQGTKATQASVATYNDALTKSQELRQTRDEKIAAFNTFSPDNKARLLRILPDNVDNIHLIIDINNIAARHGLTLKDVALGSISDASSARNALSVGASGSAVGSVELGFSVSASYENMLSFLQDLEHSLRVMDVQKINFIAEDKNLSDFDFTIRTYWLH
jgi:Tfp pilus assembly protein PilO